AITFDIVSKKGEYEGGMIIPGIRLSAESLFKNTALLPHVDVIEEPEELIGKDTKQSILSGIFFGYGEMCSGLIKNISKNIKGRPKVIITGGFADLMKKYLSKKVTKVDPDLVFKGLGLLCGKK
ncbi:MAG: type III pantothenate kinase, partial [Candidatus Omnitrophica bacterium]|nr:type III pantothenate kinase [Candidatus Omnitrophota bacterium]